MDARVNDLSSILGQLHGLVSDDRRADVAELRRRVDEDRFRILVVGEAKRGKSTFVNALLGRSVLPMGVTPLTAVATTVEYGEPEGVQIGYRDGRREDCPLDRLGDFVTEDGNPGNWRAVANVRVRLVAPILLRRLQLVDTPGTGSVFAHSSREAEGALDTMDAAVFVLTTDPPVSAGERDLLRRVVDRSVATFFVLNKADYLSLDELRTVHDFTVQTLSTAVGHPVSVHCCSARRALAARDTGDQDELAASGLVGIADELRALLAGRRTTALRMSLARHALRILQAQLDEGQLTLRAIALRTGDAASRVELFRQRLAEVKVRRTEVPGVVDGQYRRLVKQLDAAAIEHATRLRGEVGAAVRALADGELAGAPASELERQGRDHAAALVQGAVERWRTDRVAELEDAVRGLDDRLTEDLLRSLADLRTAAHDLLQLELSVPAAPQTFAVDRRFFYTLADTAGSTELLAGSVRRHLPGALARRRVQAWLARETDDLVERQVGRARADLQQRLRETCRVLASSAGRRYAESTDRLVAALEAVQALRDDTEQARRRQERDLAGRVGVLSVLSSRCQEIAGLDTAAAGNNEIEKVMGLT